MMMAIEGCILAIYYSPAKCYQFSIIDDFNCVYDYSDIFYSLEAAEIKGREAVKELRANHELWSL